MDTIDTPGPPLPAPAPSSPASFGIPVAIVIAGGFIALAIYFGGGSARVVPTPSTVAALPSQPPVPTIGNIRPVTASDHVRGAANAKVTVIEYSDLECPFCKQFHPTMLRLVAEYPNDVRWVYRHFPLEQLHQQAKREAIATECAGEQGKFWELLDTIYEITPSNDGLDLTTLPQLAVQVGVGSRSQFEACLASGKFDTTITSDLSDAQTAGGQGTPYSVIIGPQGQKTPINGAQRYETVQAAIDQALAL